MKNLKDLVIYMLENSYKYLIINYWRSIDKKILFCLSCVIFISPSFRANVIWPESAMLGLLFFLVGI